jgi:hypothetical protein
VQQQRGGHSNLQHTDRDSDGRRLSATGAAARACTQLGRQAALGTDQYQRAEPSASATPNVFKPHANARLAERGTAVLRAGPVAACRSRAARSGSP